MYKCLSQKSFLTFSEMKIQLGRCKDAEANEGLSFLSLEGTAFCCIACMLSHILLFITHGL